MNERDMAAWIEQEQREHPWADEETARHLVEDHLRDDIHYYDRALNRDQRMADDDPFPEEEERREKHGHGKHGKNGAIAIVFGKPDDRDPFPED